MSSGADPAAEPRMHADELDIDAALVRGLLENQFPQWAGLPLERVRPSGTDNAIFRLGDELVLRLPRRDKDAVRLEKERDWLPVLAPLLPLAVPVPVAVGRPAEAYPLTWSIYGWVPGRPITEEPLADQGHAAHDLAAFIAALQRVDPAGGPPPGEHNAFRGEPLAARDTATRAAIAALREDIDARAATDVWQEALGARVWTEPPVWIHGDLDARNLLVERGRLSAVIDFGCLGTGDPACDVMVAWKLFSGEARRVFRTALGVDGATWSRGRGWALSQAVGALAYYTTETNPVLVREARRWLAAVLGDGPPG